MIIKPHVPNPCAEDWDKMKIGLNSRFCENCKKDVKDFTGMNRYEILSYLFSNHDKQVCGRFKKIQLDFTHNDLLVTIQGLSRNPKNSNVAFYLLAMSTLLMASCGDHTPTDHRKSTVSVAFDDDVKMDSIAASSSGCNEVTGIVIPPTPEPDMILGEPAIIPNDSMRNNQPYTVVEIMPEFYEGMDSLKAYIKNKINYPKWEMENKIEGVVYVSFIVDKNGNIRNAKIIKGVVGAKNFDREVLNLVNQMPPWKPGKQGGQEVDVQFALPIKFKL